MAIIFRLLFLCLSFIGTLDLSFAEFSFSDAQLPRCSIGGQCVVRTYLINERLNSHRKVRIYFFHGAGGSASSFSESGEMQAFLTRLSAGVNAQIKAVFFTSFNRTSKQWTIQGEDDSNVSEFINADDFGGDLFVVGHSNGTGYSSYVVQSGLIDNVSGLICSCGKCSHLSTTAPATSVFFATARNDVILASNQGKTTAAVFQEIFDHYTAINQIRPSVFFPIEQSTIVGPVIFSNVIEKSASDFRQLTIDLITSGCINSQGQLLSVPYQAECTDPIAEAAYLTTSQKSHAFDSLVCASGGHTFCADDWASLKPNHADAMVAFVNDRLSLDGDEDGSLDQADECPSDPSKQIAGVCGCGQSDTDTDSDGSADCVDGCASDSLKTSSGICGCGVADVDLDTNGILDCRFNDEFRKKISGLKSALSSFKKNNKAGGVGTPLTRFVDYHNKNGNSIVKSNQSFDLVAKVKAIDTASKKAINTTSSSERVTQIDKAISDLNKCLSNVPPVS